MKTTAGAIILRTDFFFFNKSTLREVVTEKIKMATNVTVQCPNLVSQSEDIIILTKENVASLKVNATSTLPGTVVSITCLAAPQFQLVGASVLKCLSTGQWDKAIPVCVLSSNSDPGTTSTAENLTGSDITMLPGLVIAGIMGVIFFFLAVAMVVVLVYQRHSTGYRYKDQNLPPSRRRLATVKGDRRHMSSDPRPVDISDQLDSINNRCPPGPHAHGSHINHEPHTLTRQPRLPRDHDRSICGRSQKFTSSFSHDGNYQEESPSHHTYERRSGRTWHDLFFPGQF